jgi:hypothetical protein
VTRPAGTRNRALRKKKKVKPVLSASRFYRIDGKKMKNPFRPDASEILEIDPSLMSIDDLMALDVVVKKRLVDITEDDIGRLNSWFINRGIRHQRVRYFFFRLHEDKDYETLTLLRRSVPPALRVCFEVWQECQYSRSLLQVAKLSATTIGSSEVGKINGLMRELEKVIGEYDRVVDEVLRLITASRQRSSMRMIREKIEDLNLHVQATRKVFGRVRRTNIQLAKSIRAEFTEISNDSFGDFVEMDIVVHESEQLAELVSERSRHVARKLSECQLP